MVLGLAASPPVVLVRVIQSHLGVPEAWSQKHSGCHSHLKLAEHAHTCIDGIKLACSWGMHEWVAISGKLLDVTFRSPSS